jgi:hypothetical protein
MPYRVTAPFVMLKVKDPVTGAYTFQGLYEGAIVEEVDGENLQHHLELGMVEKVAAPAAASEPSSEDQKVAAPAAASEPSSEDQSAKRRRSG